MMSTPWLNDAVYKKRRGEACLAPTYAGYFVFYRYFIGTLPHSFLRKTEKCPYFPSITEAACPTTLSVNYPLAVRRAMDTSGSHLNFQKYVTEPQFSK